MIVHDGAGTAPEHVDPGAYDHPCVSVQTASAEFCRVWVRKALPATDKCLVHGSLRGLHPAILSQYGLESVPAVHHGVSCCFILDGPVASHVLGVVSKFAWRALAVWGCVCDDLSEKSFFIVHDGS